MMGWYLRTSAAPPEDKFCSQRPCQVHKGGSNSSIKELDAPTFM